MDPNVTFGLQCRRERDLPGMLYSVPLEKVEVSARVVDMAAEVKVVQRYLNPFPYPLDQCTYVFPLDESAAVCGFEAVINGKVIVGEVKDKEAARETYETAREAGQNAYLMEESRADVFSVSVGNLPTHTAATITITYLTELRLEGKEYAFVLPTFVAPRYSPATETDPIPDGTIPTASKGLSLQVEFDMASDILSIASPSHQIVSEFSQSKGKAYLSFSEVALDKDVVVHVGLKQEHQARVCLETDAEGSKVAMVTLVPNFDSSSAKCEFIFVIDRSGSMSGDSIRQASNALQLFMKSLPTDCYFNIVGFGDTFDSLFSKSEKYGRDTLQKAVSYAEQLNADFGGTELLPPLEAIFKFPIIDGYSRQVFILTDGEVSNTQQVIDLVRKHASKARTFTLGIGSGVSRHLVQGVARAGRGTAEYVTDNQRMNQTVIGQLKAARQPAITDVTVDWGTQVAQAAQPGSGPPAARSLLGMVRRASSGAASTKGIQTPFCVPPVFSGKRFFLYCFLDKNVPNPSKVTVRAQCPDGPLEVDLPLTSENVYEGVDIMHRLAARSMVRDLEEGTSYMHVDPDGRELHPNAATVRAEVVRLGLKHHLATKFTSFVAVDPERPLVPPPPVYPQQERSIQYSMQSCAMGAPLMRSSGLTPASLSVYDPTIEDSFVSNMSIPAPVNVARCSAPAPKCKKSAGFSLPSVSMPSFSLFGSRKKSAQPSPAPPPPMAMAPACAPAMQPPPAPAAKCSAAPSPPMREESEEECDYEVQEEAPVSRKKMSAAPPGGACRVVSPKAPVARSASEVLSQLVQNQEFDGTFPLTRKLAYVLGVGYDESVTAGREAHLAEAVWGTLLAVVFMATRLGGLKDEWELVAAKAEEWLAAQLGAGLAPARAVAEVFVNKNAMVPSN